MVQSSVPGVTFSGPMFDGVALRVVAEIIQESDQAIADEGVALVQAQLDSNLQNPTGYYRSQIVGKRTSKGATVSDSGVIYGPWLEGTSSRNQSTRFKGYASFRKATQTLQEKAPDIAQGVINRLIGQMQ